MNIICVEMSYALRKPNAHAEELDDETSQN